MKKKNLNNLVTRREAIKKTILFSTGLLINPSPPQPDEIEFPISN